MVSEVDVLKLARAVAVELGGDWSVVTSDEHPRVVLAGPHGERIIPRGKGWGGAKAGQLNWYGQLGPELHPFGDHHSINVGADRGARVIAKAITTRLLVPYWATLAAARAKAAEAAEDARRQALTLEELTMALPGATAVHRDRVLLDGGGRVDVLTGGREVTFSLPAVPFEVALRIAAVLRDPHVSMLPAIAVCAGMILAGGQRVLSASCPCPHPNGHADYVDVHLSKRDGDGVEEWTVPVASWVEVAVVDDAGV